MNKSLFHEPIVDSNRVLYTPSEFAKANLIHLQETGELQAKKPHISTRKGLASYLMFVVISGTGTLHYEERDYSLHPGTCVFIDCHKPYSHETSEDLWTLRWVHFYGPNMAGIYQKYVERGGTPAFTSIHFQKYVNDLTDLYTIATSDIYIKDMRIFEKLTSLLSQLMEDSWTPSIQGTKSTTAKRNLQDVKEYMDNHFSEKLHLDELAERFFINKYYLTHTFKEQFGITINQYLLQKRITQGKHLLRFSQYTIEQIALLCGVDDANYFTRIFKKMEGITPGEYRKRW